MKIVADILIIGGAGSVAAGVGMEYGVPFGLIAGGMLCLLIGIKAAS